jgi:UDP-N-acetylglucosamine transferase subunit ALG13
VIFVTIGTSEPFDRLVRAVIALDTSEPVVVQAGDSALGDVFPALETHAYLPFAELVQLMGECRVVVMHAGVGSVLTAIRAGKRPVVVPRLRRYGEAVDDHQVAFAHKLRESGAAVVVEDLARLRPALSEAAASEPVQIGASVLGAAVRDRVEAALGSKLPSPVRN